MTDPLHGLDPAAFAAALSQLPPTHELVAAARAAVDVADARAADRAAIADATREARAECQGVAMNHSLTRAALAGRAEVDGPSRLERFDAPAERDPAPAASDPAATAAAVAMARDWAADAADVHDARAAELARWHADDQAARDAADVPEQAAAPELERARFAS